MMKVSLRFWNKYVMRCPADNIIFFSTCINNRFSMCYSITSYYSLHCRWNYCTTEGCLWLFWFFPGGDYILDEEMAGTIFIWLFFVVTMVRFSFHTSLHGRSVSRYVRAWVDGFQTRNWRFLWIFIRVHYAFSSDLPYLEHYLGVME